MNSESRMKGQTIGLLSMLGIQFILGMILNLFVTLPKVHPGTTGNYFTRSFHSFGWAITNGGGIALILHVLVAIGLLIGSVNLVIQAISLGSRRWQAFSIIGAIGVLTALSNGLAFLGYSKDANSFIMAMGFIVAVTVYSTAASYSGASMRASESSKVQDHRRVSGKFKPSHS